MPKSKGIIERNSFIRGLITEASPLTFPENASILDENFDLNRDGSRSRRYGIDFEGTHTEESILTSLQVQDSTINSYEWFDAGTTQNRNFIVVQIGTVLHFYDIEASDILSSNKKDWTLDLEDYALYNSTSDDIKNAQTSFSTIRGMLVVTNSKANPVYVSYDSENDLLQSGVISVMTRDFIGANDGFDDSYRPPVKDHGYWYTGLVSTAPATYNTSSEVLPHSYNLYNQGWSIRDIYMCHRSFVNTRDKLDERDGLPYNAWDGTVSTSIESAWPSNSDTVQLGRTGALTAPATFTSASIGKFFPHQLYKSPISTWRAPNGKNIVNTLDTCRIIDYLPCTTAANTEPTNDLVSLKKANAPLYAASYNPTTNEVTLTTRGLGTGYSRTRRPNLINGYRISVKGLKVTVNYTKDYTPYSKELTEQMIGILNTEMYPESVSWNSGLIQATFVIKWDMSLFDDSDKTVASVVFDTSQGQVYYYSDADHIEVERVISDYSYSATASFSGRAWYAGINSGDYQNYIFFSQSVKSHKELGKCYQDGDPTSSVESDIVDTDGGYVVIPEADSILKLVPMGKNLFVFAKNGIWKVSGGETNFTATSYSVDKVSSIGINSINSIVVVENSIAFFGIGGIYVVSTSETTGQYAVKNISEQTIQSDFSSISSLSRENAKGTYDPTTKRITWLINDNPSYASAGGVENASKFKMLLIYETVLNAFFKYKISSDTTNVLPFITDIVRLPTTIPVSGQQNVYSNGDQVLSGASGTDPVTSEVMLARDSLVQTKVLIVSDNSGSPFITFGGFTDAGFLDWYTHDTTGTDYQSRLVTGYEVGESITRKKQAMYLMMFFNRTEQAIQGDITADNPSSCWVTALWDFNNTVDGTIVDPNNPEAGQFQAYRIPKWYAAGASGGAYDYEQDVIVSKSKIRGRGRVLSLDIKSEAEKDMHIYGWGIPITRQERV